MEERYEEIKVSQYIKSSGGGKEPKKGGSSMVWIATPMLMAMSAAIAYFIGTGSFRNKENIEKEQKVYKLNTVLDVIETQYVDSVDREELIQNSIHGMLAELDPHSAYIPSEEVELSNEQLQGHFGGVGIRFIILRDTLMITNIIESGPAQMAGVKAGDRVVEVDGEEIAGIGLDIQGVHDRLKGNFGSRVELKVLRGPEHTSLDIPITRGTIPLPSIDAAFMLNNSIGYVRIQSFSDRTGFEFEEAVQKLNAQGMRKLVLDLRNNGGGYLHGATHVADEFLEDGKLIVYTEGTHQQRKNYFATNHGHFEENDVVVLVNSGTASASEIVSGAIQDSDRGLIMGRRTFGKGLVQQPINMEDGSELRLTVSRYYTPTGRCIQKPYGNGIDYHSDLMERYENGELQELDSAVFENAEKFITEKGRIVYGGGGIMPDIFVPIDTSGSSMYLTELAYSSAYRDFCFDYIDRHRTELKYKNVQMFDEQFVVSDAFFNEFLDYAQSEAGIRKDAYGISVSENRIKNRLKSELATYLWDETARFYVAIPFDNDIQQAIKELEK